MMKRHNPKLVAEITKGMALNDARRLERVRQRALLLERVARILPLPLFRKGCRRGD
jgi:hypothetical protein